MTSHHSALGQFITILYVPIWRFHGLSVNHGFEHENACINGLHVIDIHQWTMAKLTSPLCIVKVKMSHGQNDMNKSTFAPSPPYMAEEKIAYQS